MKAGADPLMWFPPQCARAVAACLLTFAGLFAAPAVAQEDPFSIGAAIGADARYTDNAFFTQDKDDAGEFAITPRLSFIYNRRNTSVSGNLFSRIEYGTEAEGLDVETGQSNLNARTRLEAAEGRLSLEASAGLNKRIIDNRDVLGRGLGDDENLGLVQTYRLRPEARTEYRDVVIGMQGTAAYTRADGRGGPGIEEDGGRSGQALAFLDNEATLGLRWSLGGSASIVNAGQRAERTRYSAGAQLRYQFSSQFSLFSAGGYDIAEGAFGTETLEEPFYNVGFRYAPTGRTAIELGGGERLGRLNYGASVQALLSPRTVLSGRAQRRFGSRNELLAFGDASGAIGQDEFGFSSFSDIGAGGADAVTQIFGLGGGGFGQAPGVLLLGDLREGIGFTDSASISLNSSRRRTNMSLSAGFTETEFDDTLQLGLKDRQISVSGQLSRRMRPRLSGSIFASYVYSDLERGIVTFIPGSVGASVTPIQDDFITTGANLQRQVSRTVFLNANYTHRRRDGDPDLRIAREHFFGLTLFKTFNGGPGGAAGDAGVGFGGGLGGFGAGAINPPT